MDDSLEPLIDPPDESILLRKGLSKARQTKRHTISFLIAISLSRVGVGILNSIEGPTLPSLAQNVGHPPSDLGWIFSVRSIGYIVGSALPSVLGNRCDDMLGMTIATFLSGISSILVPITTNYWLLILNITFYGGITGYIDAEMQSVIMNIWGSEKSAPILQLHHATYSLGAFLACLIVAPFLTDHDDPDGHDHEKRSVHVCSINKTVASLTEVQENQIIIPFVAVGIGIIIVSFLMFYLYSQSTIAHIIGSDTKTKDFRSEHNLSTVSLFFAFTVVFYFSLVSGENMFYANIFSYAHCSELAISSVKATLLNSVFWAGFGLGRFLGIIISNILTPTQYIVIDMIGLLIATSMLDMFSTITAVLWSSTFLYGLFVASLYSCGISFCHQLTNMSGKYIIIPGIGNTIGSMTMPVMGTRMVFGPNPISFLHSQVALAVINVGAFSGMYLLGNHYGPLAKKLTYH